MSKQRAPSAGLSSRTAYQRLLLFVKPCGCAGVIGVDLFGMSRVLLATWLAPGARARLARLPFVGR
ncbi:hypothetical protein [Marinobacterium rhizophilum]|uniref:hypothetical protein n=1 Tax=Marinobacterium rhizophilum TaxID=420402 RepID=UPI00037B7138|nr:hypothetical protein [Marinobacterium rhizophilum]